MGKVSKNLDIIMDQGSELIKFYRDNPCIAAYELLGVDLAPIQRLVFEDMWFRSYAIVVASRGSGKTYLLGLLATLSSLLYPGYRVGLIGPVFRQSILLNSNNHDIFWTSSGMKSNTKEFYESVIPGITQIQSLETQNTILSKWQNNERACRWIKTTKGFELSGTVDHAVLILNDNCELEFKDLQNITNKDYIVIKKGFNYFGNNDRISDFKFIDKNNSINKINIPNTITTDLAYLLGLLCGDGCIENSDNEKKDYLVCFYSADINLINIYTNIVNNIFDYKAVFKKIREVNGVFRVEIHNKMLWYFFKHIGMMDKTASEKCIPDIIKKANKECFCYFIKGLMDTDGCCYTINNKKYKSCTIEYTSVSNKLCKELQGVLLNIGIFSVIRIKDFAHKIKFPGRCKTSNCKECYALRITGIDNIKKFKECIGFALDRKQLKLDDYLHNIKKECDFSNVVPNTRELVRRLAVMCQTHIKSKVSHLSLDYYTNKYKKYRQTDFCVFKIKQLLEYADEINFKNDDYIKLKKIIDLDLHFVKMVESYYFFASTIDVEVEKESCYWANGFINHNSKTIFSEIERMYSKSTILRDACAKKPVRGSDTCYLRFKSVGGVNSSYIEALPLGIDGSKIRGSRFYLLCVDELAQVPDKIVDLVLRPMTATVLEPMENVRKLEKQKKLIESGLAIEDDFDSDSINKIIMTSSGFYKFNHMWRRMMDYWKQMDVHKEKSSYIVWQIPYTDLPEGFLDRNNVEEAKRVMSDHEFKMEYEAKMISDSEGFFKASLLESCTLGSGFTIETNGTVGYNYILGIDPSQGGNASCGIVVLKMGKQNKIVNILELKKKTTQELTNIIQSLCDSYNIIRLFMDKGGGGKAIMDLLEEGYDGHEPIIDRGDVDKLLLKGRHILEIVNFNPNWISDANFTTLSMLEDKSIIFPEPPLTSIDILEELYINVRKLKGQMLNIVVTQTQGGALHFDTPKKGQNKDLYSALILAAHGARLVSKELEEEAAPILHNDSGFVREHSPNATWNLLTSISKDNKSYFTASSDTSAAILKGKRRIK